MLHLLYSLFKHCYPDVVNGTDTIARLNDDKASLCRFGDGELNLIFGRGTGFQRENARLVERLYEIISAGSTPKTLVAITDVKHNVGLFRKTTARFWKRYVIRRAKKLHKLFKEVGPRVYYDAFVTRPWMGYSEKEREKSGNRFASIVRLWNNRDVLIVEGEFSRFGVGNDLLSGARSVKRIVAPAKNAFDAYDQILDTTLGELAKLDNDVLILTVLGPTATVLSYDLSQKGFQSIDIGHLDIEYEWFLRRADHKVRIPGKYVNEMGGYGEEKLDEELLKEYGKSVIAAIKAVGTEQK